MLGGIQRKTTMPKSKLYVSLNAEIWRNSKGERHREDGPAVKLQGDYKEWFLNGLRYKVRGPSIKLNINIIYEGP